jgi:DNA-directed RNA polymerase specialized sigma24 family protein
MAGDTVTAETARSVAALYARLETRTPPQLTAEQRAAADAARQEATERGWLSPMGWDDVDTDPTPPPTPPACTGPDIDDVAIERALAGDGVTYDQLTTAEQQTVVATLTAHGRSIRDIATQLRTTKRTVSRRRARWVDELAT